MYWLYVVSNQVTKEAVIKALGDAAVGVRAAMAEVAEGEIPLGTLPLATSLLVSVSHKIFETKDPHVCLKMSDATHSVSKTLKSLVLVPMFAASGMC